MCEETKQISAEAIDQNAQHHRDADIQSHVDASNSFAAFQIAGAVVLTNKRRCCQAETVNHAVAVNFDRESCNGGRHYISAQRVDGALNN